MSGRIPAIDKGDALTARYFNTVKANVEELKGAVNPPRVKDLETGELQPTGGSTGSESVVFAETSRSTSTERVYDPNDSEVYVDVDRIDSVTFSNGSNTMKLIFNNS